MAFSIPLAMLSSAGYTKYKLVSMSNMSSQCVDYPASPAYGYGSLGSLVVGTEYSIDYSNPSNYFRFFAIYGDQYSNCHLVIY